MKTRSFTFVSRFFCILFFLSNAHAAILKCSAQGETGQAKDENTACDYCYEQLYPDDYCKQTCNCSSIFCGAW